MDRFGGLWTEERFLWLWGAQAISMMGSEVSRLALPLVAILTLDASPFEVGILAAASTIPYPVLGLFAGVAADRFDRRPILISADLGRAALLALVPLLWWASWLSIPALVAVALMSGALSVFFDITAQAFLPEVVGRERLVEANSKFALSGAAVRLVGPGVSGGIVQLLAAPIAVGVDALSFLISGAMIRRTAPGASPSAVRQPEKSIRDDIREGVRYVWRHPVLRPIASSTATFNFSVGVFTAVFILFATSELEVSPARLGIVFGAGGLGVLVGSRIARRASERFGPGLTITASLLVAAIGLATMALAPATAAAVAILVAGQAVYSLGTVTYDITQVSLRQQVTPDRLLGRMNATIRIAVWGTLPVGSLVGGLLGEVIGLRATLLVAAVIGMLAIGWVMNAGLPRIGALSADEPAGE